MKTLFLTIVLLITLNSCSNDNSSTPFEPVSITPVMIGKGFSFNEVTPGNSVISNQADWDAFLISMGYVANSFINTDVDFSLYEVIAIVDIERGYSGFSVNIDSIIENENEIFVNFYVEDSGNGYNGTGHPYHIVKIPKSSKPVIFQ